MMTDNLFLKILNKKINADITAAGSQAQSDARDAQLPLKRIALDALDLLGDPSASRLRRCANTTSCGWLFLDTSKNQRRRWCAMETCGTLDKMQRYRHRE